MQCTSLTEAEQRRLLTVAVNAIDRGLGLAADFTAAADPLPAALLRPRASFVTLTSNGQLRGCIGSLIAERPLAEDVAGNAFAAAFRDPRFAPVSIRELDDLSISLALLTEPEPMAFESETDLLRQLVAGEDGLILSSGDRRGTFLPAVWKSLPDAGDFLRQLKLKAGLAADAWPADVRVERYRTEQIGPYSTRL